MKIGELIRAKRKAANLTQIELAERAGVAVNSLRLYEAGKRSPKMDTLSKLSAVLGEDIEFFLMDTVTLEHVADEIDAPIDFIRDVFINPEKYPLEVRTKIQTVYTQLGKELEGEEFEGPEFKRDNALHGWRLFYRDELEAMGEISVNPYRQRILDAFELLNEQGQAAAAARLEELTEIPKYQLTEVSNGEYKED